MPPPISAPSPGSHAPDAGRSGTAPVFAALGDPIRLHLVAALCSGHIASITELTAGMAISRQAVTKHLRVLAEAGLVHDTRVGRERRWRLDPSRLEAARRYLEHVEQQWDRALLRLKHVVEEP